MAIDQVRLGDAVECVIDHRGKTPKKLGGAFTPSGVRVISAKNIRGGKLDLSFESRFVTEEMYDRWMPKKLELGDVLLTSEAPLGMVARLSRKTDYCLGQRLFGLRGKKGVLDSRYLYYALSSELMQSRLHARASGTTAQGIRQSELLKVELPVPPFVEQQRIAGVLGALDDKIEHNNDLIRLLEQAADLQFLKLASTTDERVALETVAKLDKHTINPSDEPDVSFAHFSIPAFDEGRQPNIEPGSAMLSNKYVVDPAGRVLFSKLNPATRRIWLARPSGSSKAVCSTEFLVLTPTGGFSDGFLYCSFRADTELYDEILSHASGTTGSRQRVKPNDVLGCSVINPPPSALEMFNGTVTPLLELATSLEHESGCLADTRDLLLPALVAGDVSPLSSYDPVGVIGSDDITTVAYAHIDGADQSSVMTSSTSSSGS